MTKSRRAMIILTERDDHGGIPSAPKERLRQHGIPVNRIRKTMRVKVTDWTQPNRSDLPPDIELTEVKLASPEDVIYVTETLQEIAALINEDLSATRVKLAKPKKEVPTA